MKNNVPKTLCQKLSFDPAGQLMKVGYIFEGIWDEMTKWFVYLYYDKLWVN